MEQWKTSPAEGRRLPRPALAAAALVGLLTWYVVANASYRAYDLGYSVAGAGQASVETWSVGLPGGAELVWWKSSPAGPNDGLRFFGPR